MKNALIILSILFVGLLCYSILQPANHEAELKQIRAERDSLKGISNDVLTIKAQYDSLLKTERTKVDTFIQQEKKYIIKYEKQNIDIGSISNDSAIRLRAKLRLQFSQNGY